MAQFKINTLLLQIKLLLWKNYKLKTRRWKEILLMIGFAVFSMLLIGVFRSDIETTTIPAYEPSPQKFFDYLQSNYHLIDGKLAIINKLSDNIENTQKILSLQSSLSQWFNNYHNNITIITNITSDTQLDNIIQTQNNDTSSNIANEIRLAIDINKWDLNNFDYTIRLPSTWVPSSSDPLINQQTSTASITQTLGIGHSYATQFIPLQIWLDEFYIQYNNNYTTNNTSIIPYLSINLQYQQFWTKSHQNDPFMDSMGSLLPFYIVSCFLLPFSYMIKDIVEEKSAKIKEGMRTMGLHILSFWISWFITYLCLISIVSSIIIFIQWKTSMFLHTSFGVLYLLYLLYGFSIITFASAMTTFFDKPKTASTVSGFVYFLLQMPAYAIKSELDTIGLSYKILFSLSSPTGMFLCLLSIIKLEQNGKGYTFNNLFDTNIVPAVQNGYTLGYSMIILFIDIIIYIIFTWFLDQYIQSQYGQKLTIKQIFSQICCCNILSFTNLFSSNNISYKPLSKHQRHSLLSDESSDNILLSPNNNDIEMDNINNNNINISNDKFKNISIQMINLSKTYQGNGVNSKSVYAVNDLTMNIYESECCAILGHNGAGKSTMINMLTGMIDVTSGTANINGYSINNEMNEIRQFLGVCPQHSLLWPMLTVYEHLYLFAHLKNINKLNINQEINLLLNDVGLFEKIKSYSSTLSGGQKRKLSLAIAFIGNPKIIFLDEPTSGMDPISRRYTWDLIEKYKENRCIVLTTHDMNEADAIADRIGIISNGKLKIYGSSLYLKSVCGVGYNLIFTINCKNFNNNNNNIKLHLNNITNIIQKYIENSILFDSHNIYNDNNNILSIEIIYKTSLQDSCKFPKLFQYIDTHLNQLQIEHYAVSVTTLEEVFLKIAQDNDIHTVPKIEGFDNDEKQNETETLSTSLSNSISSPNEELKHMIDMEEFKIDENIIDSLCEFKRPKLSSFELFAIHICTLMKKRCRVSIRDLRGIITQCIMPLLSLLFGLSLIKSFDNINTQQNNLDITTNAYSKPLNIVYNDYKNNNNNTIFSKILDSFSNKDINLININEISKYNTFNNWIMNKTYKQYPYNINNLYGGFYINPSKNSMTFLYDISATHLLPGLINEYNQGILNNIRGDFAGKLSISSHPFPLSNTEIEAIDFGITLMIIILISLSYAFIPTSFASFIVKERESKVKHQQIIAGLNIISYWISNLLFDLIIFMIPCIIGGIIILLFDIKLFTQENINLFSIILIFLLFGLSVITLTYLLSFIFKNPQSAQTILGRMYEISGLIFLIIGIMIQQFLNVTNNNYNWSNILLFIFRLFPNYSFGEALFNLTYTQQQINIINNFTIKENQKHINVFNWNILGRDLCFMFFITIFNLILIAIIEYISFNAKILSYFDYKLHSNIYNNIDESSNNNEYEDEDIDIINEKESIINGEKRYNSSIEIVGLKKIFKSRKNNNIAKIAVNNLYFSVGKSEIFGFLGSNGAGKSTTIKMLTKELIATNGNAYFGTNNILNNNYSKFFYESYFGYCSQNDGLIELLTGREHLELYCRIRGFNKKNTNKFINLIINCLNLKEFANGTVNKYSGGNRRKLCVGIALIGNPLIIILDEPSTGIDPLSRRFMWNLIKNINTNNKNNNINKQSVLLTTHSMEEAEYLCQKIGIMDNGNLKCLGSAQHLKIKYGYGYQLYIKLKESKNKNKLKIYIINKLKKNNNIKLIDNQNRILTFVIKLNNNNNNNNTSIGKIFEIIENVKSKYKIIEYSISQNTLEQVFINLVNQNENQQDNNNNSNRSKCQLCCS